MSENVVLSTHHRLQDHDHIERSSHPELFYDLIRDRYHRYDQDFGERWYRRWVNLCETHPRLGDELEILLEFNTKRRNHGFFKTFLKEWHPTFTEKGNVVFKHSDDSRIREELGLDDYLFYLHEVAPKGGRLLTRSTRNASKLTLENACEVVPEILGTPLWSGWDLVIDGKSPRKVRAKAYRDLVHDLYQVRGEDKFWFIDACGHNADEYADGNAHEKYIPKHCQERKACLKCGEIYAIDQYIKAYDTFRQVRDVFNEGATMLFIEFTIPGNHWDDIDYDNVGELSTRAHTAIKRYLRDWYQWDVPLTKIRLTGRYDRHVWSSSQPDQWKPHHHFELLNIVWVDDWPVMIDPLLDHRLIKQYYAAELRRGSSRKKDPRKSFGWSDIPDDIVVNLKYIPFNDEIHEIKKDGTVVTNDMVIRRKLAYNSRPYQRDLAKAIRAYDRANGKVKLTFYDKRSGKYQIEWRDATKFINDVNRLMFPSKGFKRRQWIGWLNPSVRSKYADLLNNGHPAIVEGEVPPLHFPTADERRELRKRKVICNECGAEMYPTGVRRAVEDLDPKDILSFTIQELVFMLPSDLDRPPPEVK